MIPLMRFTSLDGQSLCWFYSKNLTSVPQIFSSRKEPLFKKNKFIYFNWRLITLQYCIGFAILQHESATGEHVFPNLKPLPPPSPYHPSGSSQCTSPKHPVSCIEPGWRFISYMVLYMFQCHSPKSSHSLPLPQSPKTFLYICVSFAVSRTGLSLSPFYIPYICISILYWCFSFWLTSLYIIDSSFIHLIRTDSNVFFFMAE